MDDNEILTPAEVAEIFRVNPKTVTRWARTGKIRCIKTIGGHRRYRVADIKEAITKVNSGQSLEA